MSDYSSTQHFDKAEASRDLEVEIGLRRSQAPIRFQVLAFVNNEEIEVAFEGHSRDRENNMRSHGIDPDNDPWALRTMKNGRWCDPVGTDPDLKQKLRRKR